MIWYMIFIYFSNLQNIETYLVDNKKRMFLERKENDYWDYDYIMLLIKSMLDENSHFPKEFFEKIEKIILSECKVLI